MFFVTVFAFVMFCPFYSSVFEWILHRYVMHRPVGKFRYAYEAHALTHHRIFGSTKTYHLQNPKDKETIPMAWWNGPLLIIIASLPAVPICWLIDVWWPLWVLAFEFTLYYGAYECLHWYMHLPKARRIEFWGIFK